MHYQEQRRLDKNSTDKAKSLLELGVKVKLIKNHLESDTEKHVTIRDLHNLRQILKKEKFGDKDEADMLLDELKRLGE